MSTSKYFFLLNYLFHDAPHWANKAYAACPNYEDFTSNLNENLFKIGVKSEHHSKIIETCNSFSEEAVESDLNKHSINAIPINSPEYPALLAEIAAPPLTLYYKGNIALLKSTALAIVGSREPTDYGRELTTQFAAELSHYFVIVSGLALGTDALAHQGALSVGNTTIAVVANGLDIVYPRTNIKLQKEIEKKGLLLSEHPPGTPAIQYRFPQRNRVISGLSKGVLVTEAAKKSGTLITAKFATEQNRDIFALPGHVNSALSEGPHRLIQDGAKLTHTANDILSELHVKPLKLPFNIPKQKPKQKPLPELSETEKKLYEALTTEKSIDSLNNELNIPIHELLQFLTLLEAKALITQTQAQHYIQQ